MTIEELHEAIDNDLAERLGYQYIIESGILFDEWGDWFIKISVDVDGNLLVNRILYTKEFVSDTLNNAEKVATQTTDRILERIEKDKAVITDG